jgi:hypothetical protein
VDPSAGAERGPERRARSFTTLAVDLTAAITIVIPGPCADTVAHGGVGGVAVVRALPLVRIQPRAVGRQVVGNQRVAGARVRVVAHPATLLPRLPREHADDGGRSLA